MGLFGKGSDEKRDLNFVKGFLDSAEAYLKSSKNNPPDVRSASAEYSVAMTYLGTMGNEPKDRKTYEALSGRAARIAQSIVDAVPQSVVYNGSNARKNMETGDSIRASDDYMRSIPRDDDRLEKYLQQFREANPEAARRERELKENDERVRAEVKKILGSSDRLRFGDNAGYMAAESAIERAEKDLEAALEVAKTAKLQADALNAARETIKELRQELESRAEND